MMRINVILIFLLTFLLSMACHTSSHNINNRIVLINVDTLDRAGIAKVLSVINQMNPKVVSVDIQFADQKDHHKDELLFQALDNCPNLIMASKIGNFTGLAESYDWFVDDSEPEFLLNAKTGFINAIVENDPFNTLRKFSVVEKVADKTEYHLAVLTAMEFDSVQTAKFIANHPKIVEVDYRNGERNFTKFNSQDVVTGKIKPHDINGKIALIGFLGPGNEDKFFTPLNKLPIQGEPDMYGLEFLANIVAQVLEYE